MGYVFAMTIPGLALALLALAVVEVVLRRHRARTGTGTPLASTGFDELGATLYAGTRAQLDERRRMSLVRDDLGESGPGPVDLDSGVVVVRRPDGCAISSPGTPSRS